MAKRTKRRAARGGDGKPRDVREALEQHYRAAFDKTRRYVRTPDAKGLAQMLWAHGILGIGYGVKETAGALTPVRGARIYVARKQPRRSVDPRGRIPEQLFSDEEPVDTDVVPVGRFRLLAKKKSANKQAKPKKRKSLGPSGAPPSGFGAPLSPLFGSNLPPLFGSNLPPLSESAWLSKDLALLRSPQRPLSGGCSIGPEIEPGDMAGTLGCFVRDGAGTTYALSNNHVLAAARLSGFPAPVADGAPIFQPGELDRSDPYILDLLRDGQHESTPVGSLSAVVPITPSDPTASAAPTPNVVDAALAEITDAGALPLGSPIFSMPGIPLRDPPDPYDPANLLLRVVGKVGRTTGATLGVVIDIDARFWIPYGAEDDLDRYAWFVNQIGVVPIGSFPEFSLPGDSGSAIFDALTFDLVGLLFAGGEGLTLVNPIANVFAELGIDEVA